MHPPTTLLRLAAVCAALGLLSGCSQAPFSSAAAGSTPTGVPDTAGSTASTDASTASAAGSTLGGPAAPDPVRTVGPLFKHGTGQSHSCTASVLDTPSQDLILTAAHCVTGTGQGVLFVPGYAHGSSPYGAWQVSAAYVDPAWIGAHDPGHDYAVLRVAGQQRDGGQVGVEALTGGNELGWAPVPGQQVRAIAYNQGTNDSPMSCAAAVYDSGGQPTFDCPGFSDGTSGGPWLTVQPDTGRSVVRGLIGGLHQGGCHDYTSYSPAFGQALFALLARAEQGAPADSVPAVGSDC